MIKKVDVVISFINGATFNENVNELIYKKLINFIHSISCMCINQKCMNCEMKDCCRYFKITGENFNQYPGLLIENALFAKKRFNHGEDKHFVFYLIGDLNIYSDYISVFFNSLNQQLLGNFFLLKKIDISDVVNNIREVSGLRIKTPISSTSFTDEYNKMISYYNEHYNTTFILLEETFTLTKEKFINVGVLKVKTRKVFMRGYTGIIEKKEGFLINSCVIDLGCGKTNMIGGGQIEIEDCIKM